MMTRHAALLVPAILASVLLGVTAPAANAQEETAGDALGALLESHRLPLVFDAGRLGGPGAELLIEAGRKAGFFLLGEDHGTAEIPRLAGSLFRELAGAGYRHLAIETSPLMAATLESMVRDGPRDTIVDFARSLSTPLEIPFYSLHEEARLLHDVISTVSDDADVLWGLDQEFIASSPMTLGWLAEQAPDSAARRLAETLRERALGGIEAGRRGDYSAIFLTSADDATWERLRTAFRTSEHAVDAIDQMRRSARIYRLYFSGSGYQSNAEREQLMKRNFMRYFGRVEARDGHAPKVMLKFGAAHLSRGQKLITDEFSLGNFISEFATALGTTSFHVLVVAGKDGRAASAGPDMTFREGEAEGATAAWARPFTRAAFEDGWTVFDLRPLRPEFARGRFEADGALERLLWGYDAVVVIPGTTVAGF